MSESWSRSSPGDASPVGRWRITAMLGCDRDYVDEETKAFIHLDPNGSGEFHFGYVHGNIFFERTLSKNGNPAAVFTWEGNDEMDAVFGRGFAALKSANQMIGRIVFHDGDTMKFRARRKRDPKSKPG